MRRPPKGSPGLQAGEEVTIPYGGATNGWSLYDISHCRHGVYCHYRDVSIVDGVACEDDFPSGPAGWLDGFHLASLPEKIDRDGDVWKLLLSAASYLPHVVDFIHRDGGWDPQTLNEERVADMAAFVAFSGVLPADEWAEMARGLLSGRHAALAVLDFAEAINPEAMVTWSWLRGGSSIVLNIADARKKADAALPQPVRQDAEWTGQIVMDGYGGRCRSKGHPLSE